MRSKCLTLKAKGCSRLISEWDLWGGHEGPASHTRTWCQHLLFSLCSVREMLTTQAERFSKEEVTEPFGHSLHPNNWCHLLGTPPFSFLKHP